MYRCGGISVYRCIGVWGSRCIGVWGYRCIGVGGYRCIGVSVRVGISVYRYRCMGACRDIGVSVWGGYRCIGVSVQRGFGTRRAGTMKAVIRGLRLQQASESQLLSVPHLLLSSPWLRAQSAQRSSAEKSETSGNTYHVTHEQTGGL